MIDKGFSIFNEMYGNRDNRFYGLKMHDNVCDLWD